LGSRRQCSRVHSQMVNRPAAVALIPGSLWRPSRLDSLLRRGRRFRVGSSGSDKMLITIGPAFTLYRMKEQAQPPWKGSNDLDIWAAGRRNF
jgi:hypothetical protein